MKNSPDISGGKVSIPLECLIETARIAVGLSKEAVERNLSSIQNILAFDAENLSKAHWEAKELRNYSEQLEKSFGVLKALETSKTREFLEIIK